jgi:hypothetical protein
MVNQMVSQIDRCVDIAIETLAEIEKLDEQILLCQAAIKRKKVELGAACAHAQAALTDQN